MNETNAFPLPTRLSLEKISYLLDGGTALLSVADEDGSRHTILLAQHTFLEDKTSNFLPGRLYFDQHLLAVRSETEQHLITLLKVAAQYGAPDKPHLKFGVDSIIQFVESVEYLELADKVENL